MWLASPERKSDPAFLQPVNDRCNLRQGSRERFGRSAAMTSTAAPPRRVALVTGGTGGIGEGVVTALTQRGFDVVVTDRSIGGHARGRRAVAPWRPGPRSRSMAAGTCTTDDEADDQRETRPRKRIH